MKLLALTILSILSCATYGEERPNFIFIYTDDHGWPDIGSAGVYPDLKTPHLNALAQSGIRATNGYSTAPQCVPSRAGLLIGKYQNRFGLEDNKQSLDGFNAELTIAERLKQTGYTTAQIGKWHLGNGKDIEDHGFDYFYNKNRNAPGPSNFDRKGRHMPVNLLPHQSYHLDDCSEMAVTFIRKHRNDPFFLYLAYRAPHVPLDAPKKYLDRFPGEMPERRRQALAMIAAMDDGVGSIVSELKKHSLTQKTLIFFIGDNGAPLKIHKIDAPGGGPGWDGSLNKPMNGEKGMLTEGGIRVPFLISWPGTLPSGKTYDHPVIALDATTTAIHLAGLKTSDTDGINLIPHLKNDHEPKRTLYWRWISQSAIREGDWKLLQGGTRQYLFNLKSDPGELNNLAKQHPEIVERLHQQLDQWSNQLKPPGLGNGKMATTWNQYFDHYLDGKPAPRPSKRTGERNSPALTRNANNRLVDGVLQINPIPGHKQAPFLVRNQIRLSGPFSASIKILSPKDGTLGISWRLEGEKDFNSGKTASLTFKGSPEWQTHTIEVPAKGTSIHLRFHLPRHQVHLGEIVMKDSKSSLTWQPGKP